MFGQPQAVVSAHLDKLSHFRAPKKHNSENISSYSATTSALAGVSIASIRPGLNECNPARSSSTETATQHGGSLGHVYS